MKWKMPPWLLAKLGEPPSPWLPIIIAVTALAVAITSATFTGFNYFKPPPKPPSARAALVVERFEDKSGPIDWPTGGQKTMHQMRMWFTNNGQAPAKLRNVVVNTEYSATLMTPEKESQRMDYTAKNKAIIGITPRGGAEVATGQRVAYPSNSAVPDDLWSDFTSKKQILYVFALISFSDELSGDQEVVTEICLLLEPNLNGWSHCLSGHNETIRQ
jgi:hypothetical protein